MGIIGECVQKIKIIPCSVKSAIVYIFATIFSKGLVIVTTPIFTRLMPTDEIGIVNLFNSWYTLLSVFTTLSLTSGGYAVALEEYKSQRDKYVSSVLGLTSFVSLTLFFIYMVNPSFWNGLTGLSHKLMLLMFLGFLVSPALDFWIARQRYEYEYKIPVLITISGNFVASLLSIIVVLVFKEKRLNNLAEGRLVANYMILYGINLILWIYIFVKGHTIINIAFWKFSLSLSLPLIAYSIAAQILSVSDRIMIRNMVGNREIGIYGTLYSIGSISLMIWSAINASFVPYLYQNIDNSNSKTKEVSYKLLSIYALTTIGLTYFAPEVVKFIATDEYFDAIYIMPPISAGVFFTSVSNMYSNISIYYKKTKIIMYGSIISAILNLFLNYIFIPKYGYMAAAYTTFICYVILALIEAVGAIKTMKRQGSYGLVYADREILYLCIMTVIIIIPSLFLYSYTYFRYFFICCFIMLSILFTKKSLLANS